MAEVAKKTTAKTPEPPTLADMPTPAKKAPKSEHMFVAWTGEIVGLNNPPAEVIVRDFRIFGRKDLCTEFAVDQEPAWKWVQTAKGESVTEAILAKAGR